MTVSNAENAKKLIEAAIKAICEKPETFNVTYVEGQRIVIFTVTGKDKDEIAKLIGRKGRIARALRRLVSAAGRKANKKYLIEINDAFSK